jgi:hypothetical protein
MKRTAAAAALALVAASPLRAQTRQIPDPALTPGAALTVTADQLCPNVVLPHRVTTTKLDAARALFTGDWRLEYRKRFGAC